MCTDFIHESKVNGQSCNIVQSVYTHVGYLAHHWALTPAARPSLSWFTGLQKPVVWYCPAHNSLLVLYWCIPVLNNIALHSTFFTVSSVFHNKPLNVNDYWYQICRLRWTELGKGQVFRNDFSQSITSVS